MGRRIVVGLSRTEIKEHDNGIYIAVSPTEEGNCKIEVYANEKFTYHGQDHLYYEEVVPRKDIKRKFDPLVHKLKEENSAVSVDVGLAIEQGLELEARLKERTKP